MGRDPKILFYINLVVTKTWPQKCWTDKYNDKDLRITKRHNGNQVTLKTSTWIYIRGDVGGGVVI